MLSTIGRIHDRLVFRRRAAILSRLLSERIPEGSHVLDVGCGNGVIASLIKESNARISVRGLEVLSRPDCMIECQIYDGDTIPVEDSSVDVCMFVDVLHHATDPSRLVKEACRVTRRYVLIKDHLCENKLDGITLKLMDWVGNRPHGVALPNNYQSKCKWDQIFSSCNLREVYWQETLQLYGPMLNAIFGRRLHFVAQFEKVFPESGGKYISIPVTHSNLAVLPSLETEAK
jgi:SAM-dependent methyltransferase